MTYRIFCTVDRGMTDKTPVCVFPWEKALLQELHGGNVAEVSLDQLCSKEGVSSVRPIKLPSGGERETPEGDEKKTVEKAPGMREQLGMMARVPRDEDPFQDLDAEYARLTERYGMHPDVAMSVVEKVFGKAPAFKRLVQPYRGSKPPAVDPIDGPGDDAFEQAAALDDRAPADLEYTELKEACRARGIEFKGNAPRDELEEKLTDAIAAAA